MKYEGKCEKFKKKGIELKEGKKKELDVILQKSVTERNYKL